MARNRSHLSIEASETSWNIICSQPLRIEPFLQSRCRTIVSEGPSIPDPHQRRHLVITGALPGLERISGVGAHAYRNYVGSDLSLGRRLKSIHCHQLVMGVEGRGMAPLATFSLE